MAKITFEEMAGKYMEWSRDHKKTWRDDEIMLDLVMPHLGGMLLKEVGSYQIELMMRRMKKRASASRANRYHTVLSGLFTKAIKWGFYEGTNPAKKVEKYPEPPARDRYVRKHELGKLLDSCNLDLRDVVIFAIATGMRQNEIFKMEWQDIDEQYEYIRVIDWKNQGRPKERSVFINQTTKAVLDKRSKHHNGNLVFCRPDGSCHVNSMRTAWERARKLAGMEDLRFHDLRRTFASQMVNGGSSLDVVQDALGHSTPNMTKRYAYLDKRRRRQAFKVMDEFFATE